MAADAYLGPCCPVCNVPWRVHTVLHGECEFYRPAEVPHPTVESYDVDKAEIGLARERYRARIAGERKKGAG